MSTRKYTVADMITGYGVAEAVRHYYNIYGGDVKGKRAIVQGFGNVGSAAAYYLAQMGAKVVGIIDRDGGLINKEGFSFEEIKELFLNKKGNTLVSDKMIPFDRNEREDMEPGGRNLCTLRRFPFDHPGTDQPNDRHQTGGYLKRCQCSFRR